jgi:folate-dependent tRNA-U54 methylase TrmFO/GidA
MAAQVLSARDGRSTPAHRVLVLDTDGFATAKVVAAVDGRTSVVLCANVDEVLDYLDRDPDGVVVLASAPSSASQMLMRIRACRPHTPVLVVDDGPSPYTLRALGAHAIVGPDAPRSQLYGALTRAFALASSS